MSTRRAAYVRAIALSAAFAAAPPMSGRAIAQGTGANSATITGTITSQGGAPIVGALVTIRALRLSTTSNEAGVYRLAVPASLFAARPETLRVNHIGYRPAVIPFDLRPGSIVVDAALLPQALALEQVVITGTAGNQERRAQAALVESIDAADLMSKAPIRNVNELLYSRSPGVVLTQASGTSGANTRIDIRGQASVSLSNYPLIFVDGVRVTAGVRTVAQAPGGANPSTGGQLLNALDDLNPDDIETIEIVKGPAAATLYGADASAGVIQIITKRGRVGARPLSHKIGLEYHSIDPNFTPEAAYAACTAALIAPASPNPLCRGQTVGTVVSDNVLVRNRAYGNGDARTLRYSADGGSENFAYFTSLSDMQEEGTVPNSRLNHRTGRVNVNWVAHPKVSLDVNVGLARAKDRLPQGDQSSFSFSVGGALASPLTVTTGANGQLAGGWFNNNLNVEAISAIITEDVTTRYSPSAQVRYTPLSWFSNRVTVGTDIVRTAASQMYPKNSNNWYSALANTGSVAVREQSNTLYTLDYQGNVSRRFGAADRISTDLSFGSQWIHAITEVVTATGVGLLTNTNNVISGATTITAGEDYAESKSFGLYGQAQVGLNDRLYLQLGARMDRNSAFGDEVGSFFLPKAGVSYVVSEEPFWSSLSTWIPTFRVRAAYGTTGRSPSGTAGIETYSRSNYVTDAGVVQPGVSPGNPGNPNLKPERGTELEVGFDAGFFSNRAGLELTYFDKRSKDLLLLLPLAPSAGFSSNPLVNIGEVSNKGLEMALRARPLDWEKVAWDAQLNVTTLDNEIVSMGSIVPFVSNNQCFKPGVDVAGWCVPRVLSVDTVTGRATVSDTVEFVGGQLPKLATSLNTTLTLFRDFRVYAQFDGKYDYKVYNLTRDFRDRSFQNTADIQLPAAQGGYSAFERIRRMGPHFAAVSGTAVGRALVRDPYIVDGDFMRFRELSLTWSVPRHLSQRMRSSNTSITVGATNLALWTKYDGLDPEVLGTVDAVTPNRADVFTVPQTRRTFARLNLAF